MDSSSYAAVQNTKNPWTENQTHCYDAILDHCQPDSSSIEDHQHQIHSAFQASEIGQQIKLLRNCSSASRELYRLKEGMDAYEDQKLTGDLINLESLKSKFKTVTGLVEKLEIIVKNEEKVQDLLQHPYSGPHMKIEAKYHSSAIELFYTISKSLLDLKEQLAVLDWSSNDLKQTPVNFEEHLNDIFRRVENLKRINNL